MTLAYGTSGFGSFVAFIGCCITVLYVLVQAIDVASQIAEKRRNTPRPAQLERPQSEQRVSKQDAQGSISQGSGCLIIGIASIAIVVSLFTVIAIGPHPRCEGNQCQRLPFQSNVLHSTRTADLDAEYRILNARRANLDLNDQSQIAAFNQDAADYTQRVKMAHDRRARLDR
jgi:hypothetical protein